MTDAVLVGFSVSSRGAPRGLGGVAIAIAAIGAGRAKIRGFKGRRRTNQSQVFPGKVREEARRKPLGEVTVMTAQGKKEKV